MLEKGTILAGYRIDGIVGQGGMGVVYEATQLSLNRTVALKLLAGHLSDDVAFRERFRREGQIQAGIDHPHIITVHEAGDSEHGLFLAMRLIRGPNLKDMIVSRELDAGRSLRILDPIADALDTAHERGLTHRDIKPQNILVGARDHPYLADFGLTKGAGEKSLTKTGQFVGTLDYISPEQIQGTRATKQSDLYAFAAVLYECLTGVVPFPRDSEAAVLYAHLSDPPPSVSDERPELPNNLDEVIRKAMAKAPEDRFESAGELMTAAQRTFTKRARAVMTTPRPIEVPQETGVRQAEVDVPTREARPPIGPPAPLGSTVPASAPAPATTRGVGAQEGTPAPVREPAAPAPAAAASHRRRVRVLLAGLGVVVLATAAVGFVTGRSGSEGTTEAGVGPSFASSDGLELNFPDSWRRVARPERIPGLDFQTLALAPAGGRSQAQLIAGQIAATGVTLLPRLFLDRLPRPPARDDAVRLGEFEAYRYRNLRPRGFGGVLTLYVVPNTAGVATLACAAASGEARRFFSDCERIAMSLRLTDDKPFHIGADETYGEAVGRRIAALNERRVSRRHALVGAKNARDQATALASLARHYKSAAGSLARLSVSPQVRNVHSDIVLTLRRTSSAYERMASAARDDSRGAFNSAAGDVRRRERSLRRALGRLEALGYQLA